MHKTKDMFEEESLLPNVNLPNEKKKLLNEYNKNLNLDLKPKFDIDQNNSILNINKNLNRGPLGRLEFNESPLNPRFREKQKEVSYRSPEYVSLNYKTIKPIEEADDEIFDKNDFDDTMFLEGKKDTSSKLKVKVKLFE